MSVFCFFFLFCYQCTKINYSYYLWLILIHRNCILCMSESLCLFCLPFNISLCWRTDVGLGGIVKKIWCNTLKADFSPSLESSNLPKIKINHNEARLHQVGGNGLDFLMASASKKYKLDLSVHLRVCVCEWWEL